jgi:predicted GTPase
MFVLTFFDEAIDNDGRHDIGTEPPVLRPGTQSSFNKLRTKLEKMTGMRNQKQLIMFMMGAGGSGKTKVINAVMAYAKGFCKELNYMFDKRMIVVTALTGVAATLINSETTHSAAKLNYKNITSEHIDEWQKAHLLIIDEISFASLDIS